MTPEKICQARMNWDCSDELMSRLRTTMFSYFKYGIMHSSLANCLQTDVKSYFRKPWFRSNKCRNISVLDFGYRQGTKLSPSQTRHWSNVHIRNIMNRYFNICNRMKGYSILALVMPNICTVWWMPFFRSCTYSHHSHITKHSEL